MSKFVDLLLILIVFLEVVVKLAYDLVSEILSVCSLGKLMHDIHRVRWLSDSNAVRNLESHVVLVIFNIDEHILLLLFLYVLLFFVFVF